MQKSRIFIALSLKWFLDAHTFMCRKSTWLFWDWHATAHIWRIPCCGRRHGVKGGDPFPGGKRIGWLKTSDFEGYNHSDGGGFRKQGKELQGAREPELDLIIVPSSKVSNTAVERQLLACWITPYLEVRPLPVIHPSFCAQSYWVSPSMFSSFEISKLLQRRLPLSARREWNNRGERFTFRLTPSTGVVSFFSWISPWEQDKTFS